MYFAGGLTILFVDGNPSLLSMTRQHAGDPSGAARQLWLDQVVKDFVNVAYGDLLDTARQLGMGWEHKITHDDAVDSIQFYSLPSDHRRLLEVMISTTGKNLSTTSPANADVARLQFVHDQVVESEYRTNRITTLKFYTIRGSEYGIFTAPNSSAAGTNSIRLLYEGESALLVGTGDEPVFPRDVHNAIALKAAWQLKATRNLPIKDIRELSLRATARFKGSVRTLVNQADEQLTAAGLPVEMGLESAGTTG